VAAPSPVVIGRYVLFDEIATGGMATVHFGRMVGPAGFARTVAIKRLHPQFAKDPEFVSMFLDEARLAARIVDLHVVPTLDIVAHEGELLLVMEYVQGVPLSYLARAARERDEAIPPGVAVGIMVDALLGLQAAHGATSERGEPLLVVHRDVSPQNILVGIDGVARVADFGIAKAMGRLQTTREGQIKGKSGYMAPEQVRGRAVDRRTDVYAASVVLWELLVGQRLFTADTPMGAMNQVLEKVVVKPSDARASLPRSLDPIVMRGLAREPAGRYASARELALALEEAVEVWPPRRTGEWVERTAAKVLRSRAHRVAEIESSTSGVAAGSLDGAEGGSVSAEPLSERTKSDVVSVSDAAVRRRPQGIVLVSFAALLVALVALGSFLAVRAHRADAVAAGSSPDVGSVTLPAPSMIAASVDPPVSPGVPPPSSAGVPGAARPRRPRLVKGPIGQPPRCMPPYTMDANGTRHWKDGC
jgi:serine/threonine protein kinase